MNVLLFTGAGTSVELGVPAMRSMAEQFRDHLHDLSLPEEVIEKIDGLVGDRSKDMEHAIDVIDRLEGGHRAKIELGENPDEEQIAPYRTIREEAEWFVQHCCEQIKAEAAIRMWSPTLRNSTNVNLAIATTNYDRAVEIAAARLAISFEDGFDAFAGNEFTRWRGHRDGAMTTLLKLHGSTDWYRSTNDAVFKLRHPIPLFGKLTVLPEENSERPLYSALVLPSREKITTLPPFQAIAHTFRQKARAADVAIFLGSSLRDPHMRDVCVLCASSKPTFIISKSGEFERDAAPDSAIVVRQSSGRFLASTFPQFLKTQDVTILSSTSETESPDTGTILANLVRATDNEISPKERCGAIELLANAGVKLHREEVEEMMRTESEEVATFALGLIPTSYDCDALIAVAEELSSQHQGNLFITELQTLNNLLNE